MKILGIEHVGIAIPENGEGDSFWRTLLGTLPVSNETVEEQGVNTVIFNTGRGKVELLESIAEDSPIAAFLAKKGPGIHHICIEVENIYQAIAELKQAGVKLIYDEPRIGAEGFRITFVHPKSAGGVLVELAQKGDRG